MGSKRNSDGKKIVILIHGLGGNKREYKPIKHYLGRRNDYEFLEFEYKENKGDASIDELAAKFRGFVESSLGKRILDSKVAIIGLSMGGIIAPYYLEFLGGKNAICRCITLCTPFHGSFWAGFFEKKGMKQLRPDSIFLKELRAKMEKSDVNYTGVWNPIDITVLPGISAKANFMKKSRGVFAPLHQLTFFMPKTLEFIHKELEENW